MNFVIAKWNWLLSQLNLDRAIGYSMMQQLLSVASGPISILIVTTSLSAEQQGYFYTFYSLVNMRMLFDMGLSQVSMQMIAEAREQASNGGGKASRVRPIVRLIMLWYGITSLALILVLLAVGFKMFGDSDAFQPWWLLAVLTGVSYFISPLNSFTNGMGHVMDAAKMNFYSKFSMQGAIWVLLIFGFALYSIPYSFVIAIVVWLVLFAFIAYRKVYGAYEMAHPEKPVSWRKEILPFQFKVSLAWIGTYLAFQATIPLVFEFYGPEAAGAYGITVTLASALNNVSLPWLLTKAPLMAGHVVRKNWIGLRKLFLANMKVIGVISLGLFIVSIIGIGILQELRVPIALRFLPLPELICLMLAVMMTLFYSCEMILLRAYSDEPLFLVSFCTGIGSFLILYVVAGWMNWSISTALAIMLIYQGLISMPIHIYVGYGWIKTRSPELLLRK